MKAVIALLLTIATGSAMAEEDPEVPRPKGRNNIEEVRVVGYDLSEMRGMLMVGLSGAYLIHEYDQEKNEWRFIRTSDERKEE